MITKQETFRKIILEKLPKDSWINLSEIYHIVENNIDHFESGDFDPLADYNQQERWKRNVRNALQTLKAKDKIEWDGNANYFLGINSKTALKKSTSEKSKTDFSNDDKLYVQRAKLALPILVRQARAEKPIFYSDLAREIGMSNARNLNYVLGVVGNWIKDLEKKTDKKIPLINFLVINKSEEIPGSGVEEFIEYSDFQSLNKSQKRKVVDKILTEIYLYKDWYWVLSELNLKPSETDFDQKLKEPRPNYGSGGESQQHKDFKNYIAINPELFGLSSKLIGITEYELPSMDLIDVVFKNKDEIIGIEVKSYISNSADIQRGLFQCIKYKALLEAEQVVNDHLPNSRVILALENILPDNLITVKNQLGIEVYEHKRNKKM
ncbi:MAG: hypothetical protein VXW38_04395 [Bacteroidota bacterium]|nr:hypothetical protein [Bacteroidota bacterium]